jgi:hypothetical protein
LHVLKRKIVLIRPKKQLADDGNYRERRYFTSWVKEKELEEYLLPDFVQNATNQVYQMLFQILKTRFSIHLSPKDICSFW